MKANETSKKYLTAEKVQDLARQSGLTFMPGWVHSGRGAANLELFARLVVDASSLVETEQRRDRIEHLEFVLRGFYWDQVDYIKRNHLAGMDKHWMRATRIALGIRPDDPMPDLSGVETSGDHT